MTLHLTDEFERLESVATMSDPHLEEMERRDREDYLSYLQQLVDNGDITDKVAIGITKLVLDKGEDTLTEKQMYVFNSEVLKKFPKPICEQCGESIPWADAYSHIHEPGLCSSCQHSRDRFMDER